MYGHEASTLAHPAGRQEFYGEGVKLKGLVQFDDG
jgi:hypothetical protein